MTDIERLTEEVATLRREFAEAKQITVTLSAPQAIFTEAERGESIAKGLKTTRREA